MIAARLHHVAGRAPESTALIVAAPIARRVSCASLLRAGAALRGRLGRQGVRPADFVMLSRLGSAQAAATFVACAELGVVFTPVDAALHHDELAWAVHTIGPTVVVTAEDEVSRWLSVGIDPDRLLIVRDEWADGLADDADQHANDWPSDHPAACVLTSGSTGRPKIVVKTHGGIVGVADGVGAACGVGPGDRVLATVPYAHGNGLANSLILPLMHGAALVVLERCDRFNPVAAAAAIETHEITHLISSPIVFELIARTDGVSVSVTSLRVCLSGGARLPTHVADDWRRRFGIDIGSAYGTSEAGMIAIALERSSNPDSVGRAVPGTEVRIVDGEIVVRGPGVVTRYLGDHVAAPAQWEGYIRTGDRGRIESDGQIHLLGRIRPWINVGGVKIDPLEVQRVIEQLSAVCLCHVHAEPTPTGHDLVAADITTEPGATVTRADVMRHCRQYLAESKIPRVIRFVSASPAGLSGKVRQL